MDLGVTLLQPTTLTPFRRQDRVEISDSDYNNNIEEMFRRKSTPSPKSSVSQAPTVKRTTSERNHFKAEAPRDKSVKRKTSLPNGIEEKERTSRNPFKRKTSLTKSSGSSGDETNTSSKSNRKSSSSSVTEDERLASTPNRMKSLPGNSEDSGSSNTNRNGIAVKRKLSRDCAIPENLDLVINSPTLKIEDCTTNTVFLYDQQELPHTHDDQQHHQSAPIPIAQKGGMSSSAENSPTRIRALSESPFRQRYINHQLHTSLNASPSIDSLGDMIPHCPSSPLLVAVRDAVDSLSQYSDFEILEKIGAGFFAEVFKVREEGEREKKF